MSDETEDNGFLDHLFNALGHLARGARQEKVAREEQREVKKKKRKLKASAFAEAPSPAPTDCCVTKR